jgi:hypothetical protein
VDLSAAEVVMGAVLAASLSAAAGFRVFLPPLGLGLAAHFGLVNLAADWAWLSEWRTIAVLAAAAIFEISAFYIPWLDNALDFVAAPAALLAGSAMAYVLLDGADPMLKWMLVALAGAGPAAGVQISTSVLRAASTATTGGLANFLLTSFEVISASIITVAAFFVPLLALAIVVGLCVGLVALGIKLSGKIANRSRSADNLR